MFDEELPQRVRISRGGNPLREIDVYMATVDTLDVDGDGVCELLVEDYSGGAHCCFTYFLYTREPSLKLMGAFITGNSALSFQDLDDDGVLEGVAWYDGFAYFDSLSFAESPAVPLIFSLKHGRYVENTRAFPGIIQEGLEEYMSFDPDALRSDPHFQRSTALAILAHHILLGDESSGWETVRRVVPEALDWLGGNWKEIEEIMSAMGHRVCYSESEAREY